ncbi:MAG: hypothetical protein QNL33_12410 [Akkermansiaceae bacterium]|jgi:hypothetical protein
MLPDSLFLFNGCIRLELPRYLSLLTRIYDEEFVASRYRNFRRHLRRPIKENRVQKEK